MRYQATDEKDEDKATQALQKLAEEDLTLRVVNDSECRQTLLYGLSEQHLKAVADRLNARYKVSITLSEPKVRTGRPSGERRTWNTNTRSSPADTVSTAM